MTMLKPASLERCKAALGMFLLVVGGSAMASGQYVVQPGAVAGPRSCAAEFWHSGFGDANLANFTCRADAPFHFTVEAGVPESGPESYVFEGHYQFRSYDQSGYDVGLFAGTNYDTGSDKVTESLVLVPVTFKPIPDRLNVHVNLGAVHSHEANDTRAFWGAAAELRLFGPVTAVAETFGADGDDPTVHAGLRLTLLDGRLTLDASYLDEREEGGVDGWAAGAAFQVATF